MTMMRLYRIIKSQDGRHFRGEVWSLRNGWIPISTYWQDVIDATRERIEKHFAYQKSKIVRFKLKLKLRRIYYARN